MCEINRISMYIATSIYNHITTSKIDSSTELKLIVITTTKVFLNLMHTYVAIIIIIVDVFLATSVHLLSEYTYVIS